MQVLPEGGYPRVQLTEDHVGAVAAQFLGLWNWGQVTGLVHVAQHELARFDRRLMRIVAEGTTALDRRLAHAIPEAERNPSVRVHVDILAPDRCNAGQIAESSAGA